AGRRAATDGDGEGRLRLLRQRPAAHGRAHFDRFGGYARSAELRRERARPSGDRARRRRDHPPDRKLRLGISVAIGLERRDERRDGQLVGPECAHERVAPERCDALGPSDGDAGLRPAEELVTAEGEDVGALTDRVADRELLSKSEAGRVEEGTAAKIVNERDVVLAPECRELAPLRTRDETGDLEVARVHAEDRAGPLADRGRVIARVRAVRRAHLDELRSRATEHIGNAEAAADLNELAARHDDLLARGKRGESEEDRRR